MRGGGGGENRFWGLFGFSFQIESKIYVMFPSNFNIAISSPYRTCPHGKLGFEIVWLNVNYMCCGSL